MDKYVTLLGTENIERAGRAMQEAAERIRQSVGNLDDILHRDRMAREEWLARFEQVIEKLQPKEPK